MCHTHWRVYTNARRTAAVARKAETAVTTEAEAHAAPEAPAHEHTLADSLVGEGEPIESPAPCRTRRAEAQAEPEAISG
jgi:hypothetical protein